MELGAIFKKLESQSVTNAHQEQVYELAEYMKMKEVIEPSSCSLVAALAI